MNSQFAREEEQLEEDLRHGRITPQQYQREIKGLYDAYAACARESAEDAYQQELERWE